MIIRTGANFFPLSAVPQDYIVSLLRLQSICFGSIANFFIADSPCSFFHDLFLSCPLSFLLSFPFLSFPFSLACLALPLSVSTRPLKRSLPMLAYSMNVEEFKCPTSPYLSLRKRFLLSSLIIMSFFISTDVCLRGEFALSGRCELNSFLLSIRQSESLYRVISFTTCALSTFKFPPLP